MFAILIALVGMWLCFVSSVSASMIINEISPRTDPEWVELYNTGPDAVDLSLYQLIDKAGNVELLSSLATVSANTYAVFTRPKGWLNDSSEEYLYLFDGISPDPLDSLSYTQVQEGKTIARIPNLTGAWLTNQEPSMGYANPSPTTAPSPSQTPETLSPSPTPSPLVLPTPSALAIALTPTPSPSPKNLVLAVAPNSTTQEQVPSPSTTIDSNSSATNAGEAAEIDLSGFGLEATPIASSPEAVLGDQTSQSLVLNQKRARFLILTGIGLVFVSISIYLGYQKYRQTKLEL